MVLPGWQEELAQLRREHASTEEPAVSPAEPEEPVALEPDPTPWRPRNVPPSMLSQDGPSAKTEQTSQASEGEPRLQEELQADVADQLGDALVAARAVSQRASGSGTAFSSEMEEQEDEKDEAAHGEQGVAASQIDRPVPKSASDQQDVDEYATQIWEGDANDDHVADLPTTVLSVPPISVQEPPPSARERTSTPVAKSGVSAPMSKQQDEVEEQPTRPMPNNWSTPRSSTPSAGPQTPSRFADLPPLEKRPAQPTSNTVSEPGSYGQAASSAQSGPRGQGRHPSSYGSSGNVLNPPSPFPNSISQPGMATPIPETRFAGPTSRSESATPRFTAAAQPPNTPSPTPTYAIASLKQPRQTRRAGILIFLLLVLLIGGGAFWYIYYQPFTNRLAQTDQTYQNTALGFSLHYPLYWKVDYNQARSIVRFEDSSATGQVSLSRTQTAGTTQSQYVSQQEAQLGMAGQKPEPTVTFAGATWQQVRGTVNQSGATYTVTLYITQRNGYFYALTCLTIPSIYAQMEHNNFAPLRASLQFLS